ncbi:hypothetical protein F4780DRAFT_741384 [Xylariomycetidae sp. FL0641]|nr:hypothetical protein F4780DRAFT_741384 [Xylariomycetidae sp. FL0641]
MKSTKPGEALVCTEISFASSYSQILWATFMLSALELRELRYTRDTIGLFSWASGMILAVCDASFRMEEYRPITLKLLPDDDVTQGSISNFKIDATFLSLRLAMDDAVRTMKKQVEAIKGQEGVTQASTSSPRETETYGRTEPTERILESPCFSTQAFSPTNLSPGVMVDIRDPRHCDLLQGEPVTMGERGRLSCGDFHLTAPSQSRQPLLLRHYPVH